MLLSFFSKKHLIYIITAGHVMMSYQWSNQDVIKRIVHELRSHGIPVWLDIDYMGGDTLQVCHVLIESFEKM